MIRQLDPIGILSRTKTTLSYSVVLVMFNTSVANSQLVRQFGLQAGAVLAEQQWRYTSAPTSTSTSGVPSSRVWGLDAGAFLEFLNDPSISILTEVHYTQKGRTVTVMETVPANNQQGYIDLGLQDIKDRFHYITLSLLTKLRFEAGGLTPFVALGPSCEYLAWHESSAVRDRFNRSELAIAIAAGIELPLGSSQKLLAEIRYSPSVTNAYETDIVSVKNRAVQFLFGVAF